MVTKMLTLHSRSDSFFFIYPIVRSTKYTSNPALELIAMTTTTTTTVMIIIINKQTKKIKDQEQRFKFQSSVATRRIVNMHN